MYGKDKKLGFPVKTRTGAELIIVEIGSRLPGRKNIGKITEVRVFRVTQSNI